MAYRTYRNLYRIRPALSSIGTGRQRIRLPRGTQITLDAAILTIILWAPSTFTLGFLFSLFVPLPAFVSGLMIAAYVGYAISKRDAEGKTVLSYLYDLILFLFRPKVSDGWERRPNPNGKKETVSAKIPVFLLEDERVGSLPATGRATRIELKIPMGIKVKKGQITVRHRGRKYEPGIYEVGGKKVRPAAPDLAVRRPPKLRRTPV